MKIKIYFSPNPNGPLLLVADNYESASLPPHPHKQEWQLARTSDSSHMNLTPEEMALIQATDYCIAQINISITETQGVTLPANIGKLSRG